MDSIKNQTINLYVISERIIFFIRHQNYYRANNLLAIWTQQFMSYVRNLLNSESPIEGINQDFILTTLQTILRAQESNDYMLIADALELDVLETYKYIIGELSDNLEPSTDIKANELTIFESKYGLKNVCIKSNNTSLILHSNIRPIGQALQLCSEYYIPKKPGYIILGLGMGYHVIELSNMCSNSVPIYVYECNKKVIDYAKIQQYFIDNISDNINIIYDPDLIEFSKAASNSNGYRIVIHSPSIQLITNLDVRKKVNEIFIHESSIRNQMCEMLSNFRKNTLICNHYVDELKQEFLNKNVFIIAAGPSLDKNIKQLKTRPNNSVILAVGSVYKKLIDLQIIPDYVVFLDCKDSLFNQVSGLENLNTKLIVASTACARISEKCIGTKYLVCQEGLNEAEKYASEQKLNIYKSGGSVTTIAFDIAVKLKAKKIVFLGLDLSLKNGKMHADNAGTQNLSSEGNDYISIPGYYGDVVLTTPNMEIYRQWFINYIKHNKPSLPEIINATEGGCNIDGMNHIDLNEVIQML